MLFWTMSWRRWVARVGTCGGAVGRVEIVLRGRTLHEDWAEDVGGSYGVLNG